MSQHLKLIATLSLAALAEIALHVGVSWWCHWSVK